MYPLRRLMVVCSVLFGAFVLGSANTYTVTSFAASGAGTLRQAVLDANANPGLDTIAFNIPSNSISYDVPITVTDAVTIDATTQPGYTGTPKIVIRRLVTIGDGLVLQAPTTLKGLVFAQWATAVRVQSPAVIDNCWFGVTQTPTSFLVEPNQVGVGIESGGSGTLVKNSVFENRVGVQMTNSSNNRVIGSKFGSDPTGNIDLGSAAPLNCIEITGGSANTVGGTALGEGNLITGRFTHGVLVTSSPDFGFYGNTCGTNAAGTTSLSTLNTQQAQVRLVSSPNGQIGMPGTRDGGNLFAGRSIYGAWFENSNGCKFVSNTVNLNRTGGNTINGTGGAIAGGVRVITSDGAQIGDGTALGRNVFALTFDAVILRSSTNCVVDGNYMGSDVTGTIFFSGPGTSNAAGILIEVTGSGHRLGTEIDGSTEGNLVCTRSFIPGVLITNGQSCLVAGNAFGLAADRVTPLGQVQAGVWVLSGSGCRIEQNVYGNVLGGVDLGNQGRNSNDPNDVDTGANGLLNYPTLTYATTNAGSTRIRGTKAATVTRYKRISFYSSPTAIGWTVTPAGYHYLGSFEYPGGSSLGNDTFDITFPESVPPGYVITATATDDTDSTSEFCDPFEVSAAAAPVASAGDDQALAIPHDGDPNTNTMSFTLAGSGTATTPGDVLSYQWTDGDGNVLGNSASVTLSRPAGSYTFTLTVKGLSGMTASDAVDVTIAAEPNQAPSVFIFTLQNPSDPRQVSVGSNAFDPDSDSLTYEWTDNGVPFSTSAYGDIQLSYGVHTITLTVRDPYGATASDSNVIEVQRPNAAPTVDAGADQTLTARAGGTAVANLTATYNDPDGDSVGLSWSEGATALGNGTPLQAALGAGVHVITVTATDDHGATGTDTLVVSVFYAWSGFLQPINTDNSSVFKLGSTVPVKFQLVGASAGAALTARIYIAKVSDGVVGTEFEPETNVQADSGNVFRYSSGQYIYNWSTKGLTKGTYQIRADLGDGNMGRIVLISLK